MLKLVPRTLLRDYIKISTWNLDLVPKRIEYTQCSFFNLNRNFTRKGNIFPIFQLNKKCLSATDIPPIYLGSRLVLTHVDCHQLLASTTKGIHRLSSTHQNPSLTTGRWWLKASWKMIGRRSGCYFYNLWFPWHEIIWEDGYLLVYVDSSRIYG